MVLKHLCILVLWTKVASALEGSGISQSIWYLCNIIHPVVGFKTLILGQHNCTCHVWYKTYISLNINVKVYCGYCNYPRGSLASCISAAMCVCMSAFVRSSMWVCVWIFPARLLWLDWCFHCRAVCIITKYPIIQCILEHERLAVTLHGPADTPGLWRTSLH